MKLRRRTDPCGCEYIRLLVWWPVKFCDEHASQLQAWLEGAPGAATMDM